MKKPAPKKGASARASPDAKAFPIVGVGASAGGLEAFTVLLRHLPADTGMGFVLVQHLDPQHESALTHLLARATTMPVCEVTQNLRVEPDSIYVIPPNVQMAIEGGVLKLTPRGKVRGATRSIDFFLEALAHDQRDRAIGVVLSGTASDGTLGLEAVKAEGGVTFAQDDSAKFDSMPRSAIAAGVVDFTLAPEQIAAELARIAKHPFVVGAGAHESHGTKGTDGKTAPELHAKAERESNQGDPKDAPLASGGEGTPRTGSRQAKREAAAKPDGAETIKDGFAKIIGILRQHCGVDFSLYKSSTIQRRVTRRLVLNKHETLAEYALFLKGNAKELDALYSDVLISVTSFFRNPEAFDALKRKVFPKILAARGRDEPVRVWVLGCSTGQEAYSIAMTFAEAATEDARGAKLQIFATDLNEALLEKARHGFYAKSLAQDISPERLRRFFVEEEGGWRVSKLLREQVVFARQNVMSDPPFSRMDLITCRNLLIYLEPELQKKIFPAFHYALKPGGFLFLGASESIGTFTDLFALADKKQKIFSRKAAPTPAFRLPLPGARETTAPSGKRALLATVAPPEGFGGDFTAQREADRISVSRFAPPGVLIDAAGHVLQFRGATGAYLEAPSGKASFDVLKMAREGLMLPLRAALAKAKREQKPVRCEGVRVAGRAIALQVIPLRNAKELCFLVLFEEAAQAAHSPQPSLGTEVSHGTRGTAAKRNAELERELAETRDFLQSVQEQNEAATEELQASSEEVQSANEELQSINEELETSKEELESTNEELTTINDEMISRNTELNRANAYLNNVQVSIQTPILILARDLTVVRFTPPAAKLFNLLATDAGRPIHGIRHNLDLPDLEPLLEEVLATVCLREREVQDKGGRWYALRVRPFLSLENKIDGVVLVLSDIDDLKRTEAAMAVERDYAEAILRAAPVPFLVLRADLRVNSASESFYHTFQVTPAATEGRLIYEIGNGQWDIPRLRELLEEIIPRENFFTGFEVTHEFAAIGIRTMLLNARRVNGTDGVPERILLAIEDITERVQAEAAARQNREVFLEVIEQAPMAVYVLDGQMRMRNVNSVALPTFAGIEPLIGRDNSEIIRQLWPPEIANGVLEIYRHTLATGEPYTAPTFTERRQDTGEEESYDWQLRRIVLPDGERGLACYFKDVTERQRAGLALRTSEENYRLVVEGATGFAIIRLDFSGRVIMWNVGAARIFGYDEAEILGEPFSRFFTPEQIAEGMPEREMAEASTKEKSDDDNQLVRKDGSRFWANGATTALRDETGQLTGFAKIVRDVSDHRRAHEALRESEERFRVAVRAVSNIVWTNNAEGEMEGPQPGWAHFTGQTQEEYQGSGWATAVHPDDAQPTLEAWNLAVAGKRPLQFEHRVRRHDGMWRRCSVHALPTLGPGGEIREWVGVHNDVTDERAAAAALLAAKEQAEAASRVKDDFLAALSHELRTPLTPVLMTAAALETDPALPLELRDQLGMMRRNVELQARLIDDLLDITRIARGKLSLARSAADLHQLLEHTAEIVRSEKLGKQVSIAFSLEAGRHHALADPVRLQQVFWNLVKNALKFTPVGGSIAVHTRNDAEGCLVLSVEDTGVGISAEALPHIFAAFEQGDMAGQHRYGGLGLGLAISRAIVEAHGGTIQADSKGAGHGAIFTVNLATINAPADDAPANIPLSAPAPAMRLLVVEDDETTRTVLARLLTRGGHQVTTAGTIHEALLAFSAERFDAVVSDLGLPDGSGLDLMREFQRQRPVPGIALSGYGMEEDLRLTKEAGFFAHLVKPVNLDQLRQLLVQLATRV